jgi:DNA-binding transcriptional ArsR family regulator
MNVAAVAAAIGEPARTRMLLCLLDGRARTSTELAAVADITPSTASVHLTRLQNEHLVRVAAQGRHRYYTLEGDRVAAALEALCVVAGDPVRNFTPRTPERLRLARTCYDHLAGTVSVLLRERFEAAGWLKNYELTAAGKKTFEALGLELDALAGVRRRFAYACLDWSERRPHIGGAFGAALMKLALKQRWVHGDLDSRAVTITRLGRRELQNRFGLTIDE